MSPKKSVIALIVVVLLLMAGGIVGAFILSSPSIVGSGEDHFNDVKVGDSYSISVTANAAEYSATYKSKGEYYEWLYLENGTRDPLHTKDITVNGVKVTCDCYYEKTTLGKNVYFINGNAAAGQARTYGYEVYEDGELTDSRYLVSTNFDLNKTMSEQKMTVGTTMSYITRDSISSNICPAISLMMDCTVTETVGSYDISQMKYAVSIETLGHDSESGSTEVRDYVKDPSGDKIVTTDGKILTKDAFLMTVNYNEFLAYIKNTGAIMSRGIPEDKTIETAFGTRDVTEETLNIFGSFNARYTVDFGSDYVIYSITEYKNGQEGSTVTTLTSCSFMYEGTKEVYGTQLNLTLNSFVVAIIVIVIAAVAAILIGRLVFNIIYHKTEKT